MDAGSFIQSFEFLAMLIEADLLFGPWVRALRSVHRNLEGLENPLKKVQVLNKKVLRTSPKLPQAFSIRSSDCFGI